ncbi:MAG: fumarylacetoacetate hydrolase family protein [Candidatus Omnitrophota bacterium]
MNIVRFLVPGLKRPQYGVENNGKIHVMRGNPYSAFRIRKSAPYDVRGVRFECPVEPSKIVLVGLNYRDHAEELGMAIPGEPVIFLKPPCSLIGHMGAVIYPGWVGRLDYEAELAVVIGKVCRRIRPGSAAKYILGYTCLNDVTARDIQKMDGQWTRAKSFDTFCPVGPCVTTGIRPSGLDICLTLNGRRRQFSNTGNMIFGPAEIVSFVSNVMTLLPGDIISTGTPPGVGPMGPGDTVSVSIEQIGTLTNTVRAGQE